MNLVVYLKGPIGKTITLTNCDKSTYERIQEALTDFPDGTITFHVGKKSVTIPNNNIAYMETFDE